MVSRKEAKDKKDFRESERKVKEKEMNEKSTQEVDIQAGSNSDIGPLF
jgi:hypothetical protein